MYMLVDYICSSVFFFAKFHLQNHELVYKSLIVPSKDKDVTNL